MTRIRQRISTNSSGGESDVNQIGFRCSDVEASQGSQAVTLGSSSDVESTLALAGGATPTPTRAGLSVRQARRLLESNSGIAAVVTPMSSSIWRPVCRGIDVSLISE